MKGFAKLRIVDNGAKSLLKMVARNRAFKVGVFSSAPAPEGGGGSMAELASYHELGAGVPRRSWLRDWVDTDPRIKKLLNGVPLKARTTQELEKQIAQVAGAFVGFIQQRIANGIQPANAPSTIAAKGSSTPLIDSGQFRTSITYEIEAV